MRGRRGWAVAGTAAAAAVVFAVVSWPRGLDTSVVAGRALSAPPTLPSPSVPAPVVAAPSTEAAAATVEVDRGNGRRLRVGTARPVGLPATVADATGASVPLYSAPGAAEPDDWMDNPTWEGLPAVFLVQERRGDWLNVQVSMRPNMATAWVRASDVALRQVGHRIFVDTAARRLAVYDARGVVFEASVAPGVDRTPTPTGDYFVDGVVALDDTSGPYGAYQISVAAFSNVLHSFAGGNGQIAIHGTNNPALIGTPASNGCVRMTNSDITRLTAYAAPGTPVQIV